MTVSPCGEDSLRPGRSAELDPILLDVILPRMDGYEVVGRIRHDHLARSRS